jgi:hypothetical protein
MRERCPPKHVLPNLLWKLHEGKSIESMATMHQSKKMQTMRSTKSVRCRDPVRQEILGNVRVYPSMESVPVSFYSKAVMSLVQTQEKGFRILFYGNRNKRGKIFFRHVEWLDLEHSEMHGIRYWKWVLLPDGENLLHDLTIIDYVILLPKSVLDNNVIPGEYTMVTK